MGYMKHDTIVCTCWNIVHLKWAWDKAVELGLKPTKITDETINGYRSFLIPPDGSKEGWSDSNDFDGSREDWEIAMKKKNLYVDWVHLRFGGDDSENSIVHVGHYVEPSL